MQIDFAVAELPQRPRFDACSASIADAAGVCVDRAAARTPFAASWSFRFSAARGYCTIAADAHRVRRRPADIACRSHDSYCIYREGSAGAWWRQGGREFTTRSGDLLLTDIDMPFETTSSDSYPHEAWALPKSMLDPHLPLLRRPLSVVLSGRSGVAALAATYLQAVTENWDSLDGPLMHAASDTLCRLIGMACGHAAAEQPDAVREARLLQAKRHIELHLADPALTPAGVARALGVSLRGLHLLFEPTGTSFARHVLRRRLEECRAALLANSSRPVLDIALAWGFSSLSSFYRAFQAAFGMSPGEVRGAYPPAASKLPASAIAGDSPSRRSMA